MDKNSKWNLKDKRIKNIPNPKDIAKLVKREIMTIIKAYPKNSSGNMKITFGSIWGFTWPGEWKQEEWLKLYLF